MSRSKKRNLFEESLFIFEYKEKNKTLFIINKQNPKNFMIFDLKNEEISGDIEIYWDLESKIIDPFDSVYNQSHHKELLNKFFTFLDIKMKCEYSEKNLKYKLKISRNINGISDPKSKIIDLFDSKTKFLIDLNLNKNKEIKEKDKFLWFLRNLKTIEKIDKGITLYKYNMVIKNISINDKDINSVLDDFEIKSFSNIESIIFENCSINIRESSNLKIFYNVRDIKHISCDGRFLN